MRAFFLLLWIAMPIEGNDTLATLGAGGLIPVQTQRIAMEREDLEMSVREIRVRYIFRNLTDKDIDATVAFPLPDLEGGTVEHVPLQLPSKDPTNFVDFEVRAGGRKVETSVEMRALHNGRDISAQLRQAGLPVSVVDRNFEAAVRRLSPSQRRQLEQQEWIVSDDPSASTRRYWPNWTTKVQYSWRQRFPAKAAVQVEHTYRPIVGGAYLTVSDDGAGRAKEYCGAADAVEKIRRAKQRHPVPSPGQPQLFEKRIAYVLTTANNWSGPIGNFHLVVNTSTSDDVLLTCFAGLKPVGSNRYEFNRANFRPDHDLDLLLLTPNR